MEYGIWNAAYTVLRSPKKKKLYDVYVTQVCDRTYDQSLLEITCPLKLTTAV